MINKCIFCSIVNKNIESNFLYDDEQMIAINDINPQAPVHILIIPKKHIRSINDITNHDKDIISNMILLSKKLANENIINKSGYKIFFNVEKGGGQVVFHLHLHLIGGWNNKIIS